MRELRFGALGSAGSGAALSERYAVARVITNLTPHDVLRQSLSLRQFDMESCTDQLAQLAVHGGGEDSNTPSRQASSVSRC